MLRKLEDGGLNELFFSFRHRCDPLAVADVVRQRLFEHRFQSRLIVVELNLARSTSHEQEDDSVARGRKCGSPGSEADADC